MTKMFTPTKELCDQYLAETLPAAAVVETRCAESMTEGIREIARNVLPGHAHGNIDKMPGLEIVALLAAQMSHYRKAATEFAEALDKTQKEPK